MKSQLKGLIIGMLSGAIVATGIAAIASEPEQTATPETKTELETLYNVKTNGINIVIDGKEFTCTDANGAVVNPMIYNGTTYIPVRAVSSAFGKAVYWDGDTSTVYLGDMDGALEKPTAKFADLENIAHGKWTLDKLSGIYDNYGNYYTESYFCNVIGYKDEVSDCCEFLLDGKYSKFKATLFVREGVKVPDAAVMKIIADGKEIYRSPEIVKVSKPIDIEVDLTGANHVKFEFDRSDIIHIANEGFYQ